MHFTRTALKKGSLIFVAVVAVVIGGQGLAADEVLRSSHKVKDLVRQVIDVYGGRYVLNNIHSLSARGILDSPMYERPAEYSLDLREDRKLRVEIRVGNSLELRILNGSRGYYGAGDSPLVAVSGPRFLSMVYQFKELTMPHQLMASSFTITDGGRKEVNDTPVRLLLLTDSEGPPMRLYVDLKTRRIIKDSGIFTMGSEETVLSSEFHDFRKVHGRLLPFRVVNYGGGQRIGEVRINEYRVNPQLPDSLFSP
jgi:hypothetical protein